jgi:hypothetical protein
MNQIKEAVMRLLSVMLTVIAITYGMNGGTQIGITCSSQTLVDSDGRLIRLPKKGRSRPRISVVLQGQR